MDPEDNRRSWAERSGNFSPEYYADIGQNEVSEAITSALEYYVSTDARILEVGCSSGRHLEALRQDGYRNLTGIDINDESFDVMADRYPTLHSAGTFHVGPIEDIVPEMDDDAFDVVYSVETVQHVHPDEQWVFEELVRITDELLITAENEGNSPDRGRPGSEVSCVDGEFPLYHRDWKQVFSDLGMAQIVCKPTSRDTVRVFRSPE
ncbi:methyltransferase domain-containing protein [Halapricum sp. CBA1109]|uniref:class I SAM-dependent methyltransferase n=1 Tax=Halapricum sp. CBA1109 TaxID=2668068 RepID=UPI0012F87CFA|nr:class I SAM-dependent methyltransferase [Halapricum sp. CBA1109]MUV89873.1 methyltransferase domain-containing protein [Halapricum sp. CBA1109]